MASSRAYWNVELASCSRNHEVFDTRQNTALTTASRELVISFASLLEKFLSLALLRPQNAPSSVNVNTVTHVVEVLVSTTFVILPPDFKLSNFEKSE